MSRKMSTVSQFFPERLRDEGRNEMSFGGRKLKFANTFLRARTFMHSSHAGVTFCHSGLNST